MPTLDWIGKNKVINHHQEVPYRVLERQYSYDTGGQSTEDNGSENMIIHGDNLEALKSLLPRYERKVDCIYIDPPYNTGNEGWTYNDNVNDPQIKKWLGEVVGKEGEDLSRHDKWLCMMYPRLRLLQKLLADDGVIFISIDDNELYSLKNICDEIFGSRCFVANISWQRTYSIRNDSKGIPMEIEHLLIYSKKPNWQPNKLPRTEKMNASYKNPDGDRCTWMSGSPVAPNARTHQGMVYAIQHPFTGKMIYPPSTACWRYEQGQMLEYMNGWCKYRLEDLSDDAKRAEICGIPVEEVRKNVKGIVLAEPFEIAKKKAKEIYDKGPWPRFYFTKKGKGGIRRKVYSDSVGDRIVTNFWNFDEVGHTDEAKKELKAVFGGTIPFDTPKPIRLIKRILQIKGNKYAVILDSFAGSGTTAHAVLNMNKSDGGKRKFILVELMDYADTITAERIKRVIQGYGKGKKAVEGTEGSFSYYELGAPLLIGENINEEVGIDKIREYIWYMETKQPVNQSGNDNQYYLGDYNHTGYYFYYELDEITVLDHEFMSTITEKTEHYVIYADICALSEDELVKFNITFKKIPRDITRL